jgi:hypothetical protein
MSYNVWMYSQGRWIIDLSSIGEKDQDPADPLPLIYVRARKVLEGLSAGPTNLTWAAVRILQTDGTPGPVMGYNVWIGSRWTNIAIATARTPTIKQDIYRPHIFTYLEAEELQGKVGGYIMEINSAWMPTAPGWMPPSWISNFQASVESPVATVSPSAPKIALPEIDFDAYNGFKR